jgi:hypothetical protein
VLSIKSPLTPPGYDEGAAVGAASAVASFRVPLLVLVPDPEVTMTLPPVLVAAMPAEK